MHTLTISYQYQYFCVSLIIYKKYLAIPTEYYFRVYHIFRWGDNLPPGDHKVIFASFYFKKNWAVAERLADGE